jgi:hypothetical protein
MAEKSKAAAPRAAQKKDEFRTYEEWFVASPDPWNEIAKLEPGGDRTFASTVRSMVLNAEPAQRPGMETKLLAALAKPGLTDDGRMFVSRMLALIGTAKAVPALTPLLHDARTADAARYALDAIDDAAVNDVYRAALEKLTGAAKAGLIGSIALRGDPKAVSALTAIKGNAAEPAEVRTAATRALERLNHNA